MNMEMINKMVKLQRENTFLKSNQLSLGELIQEVEKSGLKDKDGNPKEVYFDFGYMQPIGLDSWRGSYDELSLEYSEDETDKTYYWDAEKLLSELRSAIGKEYTGYKGGEYTMSESTPVWVAKYGMSGNTGVVGVLDDGWRLIIITAYCEF